MKKHMKSIGVAVIVTLIGGITSVPVRSKNNTVYYGTTSEWGSIITLENGDILEIIDPPEYEDGTYVKVIMEGGKVINVIDVDD